MAKLLKLSILNLCLILLMNIATMRNLEAKGIEVILGEFLVGVKEINEDVISLIEANQGEVVRRIDPINVLLVRVGGVSSQTFRETVASNPSVKYVESNGIVRLPPIKVGSLIEASQVEVAVTPDDTFWSSDPLSGVGQWNMRVIDADDAWDVQMGSPSVIVAVLDTGVFKDHTDLKANYVAGGYDWVNDDNDPSDDHFHGTYVAGIIAGETNNAYGLAGLAQVSIIAEKVLDSTGSGTTADLASGIIHAADFGAHIISMSLGGYDYSTTVESAINYAHNKGSLLIAAAGNEDTSTPLYPAAFDNVIAVASTYGEPDTRAPYSNYGDWITVSAPGGWDENENDRVDPDEHWVLSLYNIDHLFAYAYSTSISTPHVSGVAALYKSWYPAATNTQIEEVLKKTAEDKGSLGWDHYYGYGRINAYKALLPTTSVGGEGEIIAPVAGSVVEADKLEPVATPIVLVGLVVALVFLTLVLRLRQRF